MARCSYTFVVSLVLTSSIAFLAAHIVRTLFLQVSKRDEIEECNEEDLDCAGQLRNIQVRVGPFQVRVGPFPIYYSPSVQSQAALVDGNTLECSALNTDCCADKRAKYVSLEEKK